MSQNQTTDKTVIVANQVRKTSEFEGAVMVTTDGAIYRIVNARWEKVSDAPVRNNS